MLVNSKILIGLFLLLSLTSRAAIIPADRLATWEGNVGVLGGIPDRTTIYTNISAGASTAAIQAGLNACPSNQVVLLGAGHFYSIGSLVIPTGVTIRGAGISNTILHKTGTIRFGSQNEIEYEGTVRTVISGGTIGSTNITLNSVSGMSAGMLMVIDKNNDASLPVTILGQYGNCTWASRSNGVRSVGQTLLITNVAGSTVSFSSPLFWHYTNNAPEIVFMAAGCELAGIEDMTLYEDAATGEHVSVDMSGSKYCWIKGVEWDFVHGDYANIGWSYRCEVRECYLHDGFDHNSGNTDCDLMIHGKSSGVLVEDNIFRRTHASVILNSGASGNVIAYNFSERPYDDLSINVHMNDLLLNHRPHPMFNLIEGNVCSQIRADRAWGSSSHGTIFRNYVTCSSFVEPPYSSRGALQAGHWAYQALRGISIDAVNEFYNIAGNILLPANIPSKGANYSAVYPDSVGGGNYEYKLFLLAFGYSDIGASTYPDTACYTNAIIHGNYDSLTNGQRWDVSIVDTNIPDSYYLSARPDWFGDLAWPPFDPSDSTTAQITNIPAGYRWTYGTNPPPSTPPTNAPTITSVNISGTNGYAIDYYKIQADQPPHTGYAATNLPAGLSVNASSGVISGTPTTTGTNTTGLFVTNSIGLGHATIAIAIVANPNTNPPVIVPASGLSGVEDTAFYYQVVANGGVTNWGASGLNDGLSINASGVISGTPTTVGSNYITVSATNEWGDAQTNFGLTITAIPQYYWVGNTNAPGDTDSMAANDYVMGRFTAAGTFTSTNLWLYTGSNSGNYAVAVYDNSSPQNLLASSGLFGPTTAGWTSVLLTNSVSVTNGQDYWLATWTSASTTVGVVGEGGPLIRFGNMTFTNWPTAFSTTNGSWTGIYSVYVTNLTGASPPSSGVGTLRVNNLRIGE